MARLRWTLGVSLTSRILAVNIIALGLLAGSLFYLDSYRNRLLAERYTLASSEAVIAANALAVTNRWQRRTFLTSIAADQKLRLRLFDKDGDLIADSFKLAKPTYALIDPATEPWYQNAARTLDRGMDFMLGTPPLEAYSEPGQRQRQGLARSNRGARGQNRRGPPAPRPRPHAGDQRRRPGRRFRQRAADHPQRHRHHPERAQCPPDPGDHRRGGADHLGPAVAVPRADHRPAAAHAGARGGTRAAGARARGDRAPPARTARRDRPARPRDFGHDLGAAGEDRRGRKLRRRCRA